jgi:transposase
VLICQCGCDCKLKKIGEEVTEQLVIIPEKVYVRQHIRFKYGGCEYDSTILIAPMAASAYC